MAPGTKLGAGQLPRPHVAARMTRALAAKDTGVSKGVATSGYDDTMPIFSTTGHFEPKALDTLAGSFVDTKLLPTKPDMSQLYTEAYLSK